jgi:uncharacterized protein YecE (DUF72 family)
MEFGKLESIEQVDWAMPPVSLETVRYLRQQPQGEAFALQLGTPAWAHREWIGKIYPKGCKPADFLHHYSRQYSTIEFNSSHYQIPTQQQTTKWIEKVSPEFLFCPKVYQGISHAAHGLQNSTLLKSWLSFLERLGGHCGPCFLQLPPSFDYRQKAELHQFLKLWPREFQLAIEFRHPSWFAQGSVLPMLGEYLFQRGIGVVITDVAGRRDVLHSTVTADFTMIRFIGNGLHPSDADRMQLWSKRLAELRDHGLRRAFIFIHEPDDILCPEMTNIAVETLNAQMGLNLRPVGCELVSNTELPLEM